VVLKTVAFDKIGLPGSMFSRDDIEYYSRTQHTNMDLFDHVQEDDLKQVVTIMASFIYNAAMRDEKLPKKVLESIRSKVTLPPFMKDLEGRRYL
jgi:hypothetical protein